MKKFQKYYYDKILKEADSKGGYLETIDLWELYISELPEFLKDVTVSYFYASRNKLTTLKNIPKCTTSIGMEYNMLTSLDGIQNLPTSRMSLEHNKLRDVEALSQFSGDIYDLELSNNNLVSVNGLQNLRRIGELGVATNQIKSWDYFPPTGIKMLYARGNKLTSWKGMPRDLAYCFVWENWDVQNFDDFELVKNTVCISSSLPRYDLFKKYKIAVGDINARSTNLEIEEIK